MPNPKMRRKSFPLFLVFFCFSLLTPLFASAPSIVYADGSYSTNKGATNVTSWVDPAEPYLVNPEEQEISKRHLVLTLSVNDYGNISSTVDATSAKDILNFMDKIIIDGTSMRTIYNGYSETEQSEFYVNINWKTRWGCIAFRLPSINDVHTIDSLVIEKGCQFPSLNGDGYFVTANRFANKSLPSSQLTKAGDTTIVSDLDFGNVTFTHYFIRLANHDYGVSAANVSLNATSSTTWLDGLNLFDKIYVNGKPLRTYIPESGTAGLDFIINYQTRWGCLSFKVPGIPDVRAAGILIEEGCELPAYNNGVFNEKYYVVSERYERKVYTPGVIDEMESLGYTNIFDIFDEARVDYNYFFLRFSVHDYGNADTGQNNVSLMINAQQSYLDNFDYLQRIKVDGKPLSFYSGELKDFDFMINRTLRWGSISFKVPGYDDVRVFDRLTVESGTVIPAYRDGALNEAYYTIGSTYRYVVYSNAFGYEISDEAVTKFEDDEKITYSIETNYQVTANPTMAVDGTKVLFNDVPINEIPSDVTLKWVKDTKLNLVATVDKNYDGLRGKDFRYINNHFILLAGLPIPENDPLTTSYRLYIYDHEIVTERYQEDDPDEFLTNAVSGVEYYESDGSNDGNPVLNLTFATAISNTGLPAEGDYYVACSENWKRDNLQTIDMSKVYDEEISRAFMHGGYKTSLMNHVLINGMTIGEWFASSDPDSWGHPYALMVHYGMYGPKVMSIIFTVHDDPTINRIRDSIEAGTATVTVKPGLKFITHNMCKTEQHFKMNPETNAFVPADIQEFKVFYAGKEVSNHETIEIYGDFNLTSVYVAYDGRDYEITAIPSVDQTITTVNISQADDVIFTFNVKSLAYGEVPAPVNKNNTLTFILIGGAALLIGAAIPITIFIRRKKHAK